MTVEDGILVLRGACTSSIRRILYVNSYGMARAWRLWEQGLYPGNHLWGCLELARRGYEILIPEPASGKGIAKRFKNDWLPAQIAVHRLKKDDIVYCGHNILLWTPLFKMLKAVRCKIVGLLFAKEPLVLAGQYDGVIAHTPVAQKNAAVICPNALCAHISWGMDIDFFTPYSYEPHWMLSCGKTFRDFYVMAESFRDLSAKAVCIHPYPEAMDFMPPNIAIQSAGAIGEGIYATLTHYYYRYSSATLLTLVPDSKQRHSIGLTNLFESMACARPVIVTRTSALISEIDVEAKGIGLFVEPEDVSSLKKAVNRLQNNPDEAREMGLRGRQLCEQYYSIDRFAEDLHSFFEKL